MLSALSAAAVVFVLPENKNNRCLKSLSRYLLRRLGRLVT